MKQKSLLLKLLTLIIYANSFAQPTINSFTPISGPIGTTVTINGNNFSPVPANNIVFFGTVKATVSAASATSLTVTVPIGATYQPITVTTDYLTAYAARPFVVTFTDGGAFADKIDFPTARFPTGISIADLDGDNKPDIAFVNLNGSNTVSVYRNTGANGSISFAERVNFPTGGSPYSLAIKDLDGDGMPDLAVCNSYNNTGTISIFRNTGSNGLISFDTKKDYATGIGPLSVSIGDLNGDGKPDLVVANYMSSTISIFQNMSTNGTIFFAAKRDFTVGIGVPVSVSIGDLDGDGKPDLAAVNGGNNSASILRNIGTSGTIAFAPKIDFSTGADPYSVSIGDLDGDGKPDLAVANKYDKTASVLRNTSTNGTIAFAPKVDFAIGQGPWNIAIGDLDGDGKPDLATANGLYNTVSVLLNLSASDSISFAPKMDYPVGDDPTSIAIGDLDEDGKPDLVLSNGGSKSGSVLRNININSIPVISKVTDINSSQAVVHWYPFPKAVSYLVRRFRAFGDGEYKYYLPVADTFRRISNMRSSSTYSVQVKAIYTGNNDSSEWSSLFTFFTSNKCYLPSVLKVTEIADTCARLNWNLPAAGVTFVNIRYRKSGTTTWIEARMEYTVNNIRICGLSSNTTYEWNIRNLCTNDRSQWVVGPDFTTTGALVFPLNVAAISESKIAVNNTVQILPNPNKGIFTIQMQLPAKVASTTLALYNSLGVKIWQQDVGKISGLFYKKIALEKLSAGIYLLKIARTDVVFTQKIMINR